MSADRRRTGSETKAEAQRVALSLFSSKGYESTSMREIAESLGINKASLYYHFASKEDIVLSLLESRGDEASRLLDWVKEQEPAPDLLERTIVRWVESQSVEKLRGIRFINANPLLMRTIAGDAGRTIRDSLEQIVELVAKDETDPKRRLLIRMAFLSINSAVSASGTSGAYRDEDVVASAEELAAAIVNSLGATRDSDAVTRSADGRR